MERRKTDKHREKFYLFVIFLFMVFNHNVMYLVNPEGFKIADISVLISIFMLGWAILSNIFHLNVHLKFKIETLWMFAVVAVSAYVAHKTYAQPIGMGIRAQRGWMAMWVMYLALGILCKNKIISLDGLKKTIYIFCDIYLIECIIQLLVGRHIMFTVVGTGERYGGMRFFFEEAYVVLYIMMRLNDLIHKDNIKEKLKAVFWMGLGIFFMVWVLKARMAMLSMGVAIFFGILISKSTMENKMFQCFF